VNIKMRERGETKFPAKAAFRGRKIDRKHGFDGVGRKCPLSR